MSNSDDFSNNRVLVIDDNEYIHRDFRAILEKKQARLTLQSIESTLFSDIPARPTAPHFLLDSAFQGAEGFEMVKSAVNNNTPYALAFVDMRMPPGWNGMETISHLWEVDPDLQIVICTAYSDYSWSEITDILGPSDKLLILKKPFENIEVQQITSAMVQKWQLGKQAALKQEELELRVLQRTKALQETNNALEQSIVHLTEAQTKLVQSEKMAALGSLVAGVAHEINTPIGIGVTAASHLERKAKQYAEQHQAGELTDGDLEGLFDTALKSSTLILANLSRAANLIRSFKQVAVDQSSKKPRIFNLKEYLDELLLSLSPTMNKTKHAVVLTCPPDLVLNSYPGVFSQIFTNLVVNSLVHGFEEDGSGQIDISITSSEHQLSIEYSDDGKGMPADLLHKIFEPFFTTRRSQGGSGLGLNIVYNLVTQSLKGQIRCTSELGRGTTFTIELPLPLTERAGESNSSPAPIKSANESE